MLARTTADRRGTERLWGPHDHTLYQILVSRPIIIRSHHHSMREIHAKEPEVANPMPARTAENESLGQVWRETRPLVTKKALWSVL